MASHLLHLTTTLALLSIELFNLHKILVQFEVFVMELAIVCFQSADFSHVEISPAFHMTELLAQLIYYHVLFH